MSQFHAGHQATPDDNDINQEELEHLLLEGVHLQQDTPGTPTSPVGADNPAWGAGNERPPRAILPGGQVMRPPVGNGHTDVQGALGLFAEAAQDLATAGLELGLGRHFACVDYCNQVAEKAAQSVSLLRFGRPSSYDHDLRALGASVGAPPEIQDEMALLNPFHPETFYADTPPEEADEVISAEQAEHYVQSARRILRWARSIVLK